MSSERKEGTAPESEYRPVDVTAWVGGYPFRDIPHPQPEILAEVLVREGFSGAWVGSLPGAFHRDPAPTNRALYKSLMPFQGGKSARLIPAPIVRPDWPEWEQALSLARDEGAQSVRVYPAQWGYSAGHPALSELAYACGEAGLVLHMTVRFEDSRQRHYMDTGVDLSAATVRAVARLAGTACRVVVAGAGRDLIEEIHWGLTPEEQRRVWYDFHWVWGPPEDDFAHLVNTLGAKRLVHSSWWPLRLAQQRRALLELLPSATRSSVTDADFADGERIVSSLS